ncbi:hypothetical protein AUC71_07860 [Methyloceanibacter marginalis]|uniref:Uncharacterized protein n=1 Tax=Methyloceanibacter marginalis TaxID=1774971 RepID=A0A1E3WFG2_9HYPH|nr:hypothetical protein AUC71_07860 [Methyloceanibacter marginalis]
MLLAVVALTPFLGAVIPLLAIRHGRNFCAIATGAVTLRRPHVSSFRGAGLYRGEVLAWSVLGCR